MGTSDFPAACALLAPATRERLDRSGGCVTALAARPTPIDTRILDVQVWGDRAAARTARDTLFVLETPTGWKVSAAGCRSRGEAPYDCALEGP